MTTALVVQFAIDNHVLISAVAYSLWEHWLGKTKAVDANSTWELVGNAFKFTFLGGTKL